LLTEQSGTSTQQDVLSTFVNVKFGIVGRTVSTKDDPNTSGLFHFWLSRHAVEVGTIEIGSIIAAYADDGRELTFGTVQEMRSYSEAESFTADFAIHDYGQPYAMIGGEQAEVVVATCAVIRNLSSRTRPIGRCRVYFPSPRGIQFAFGIVDAQGHWASSGAAIPIGIFENGDGTIAPVSVDENFLVGPEAAHLSVSGISGLACKTSALQFALKSLQRHTRKKIAVVVMNVKSKDLLYIDQINTRLQQDRWSQQVYENLDIPIQAFVDARFFAPSHPKNRNMTQSLRTLPTESYRWDLKMLYDDIPSLFHASEWDDNIEGAWYVVREEIERGRIITYSDMIIWIDKLLSTSGLTEWPRGYTSATWFKLKGHLKRFTLMYRGLIETDEEGRDIPWNRIGHGDMYVVDIQMLSQGGQKLVFSRTIQAITQQLETRKGDLDAVVVFVDELNKFAPAALDRTPLKTKLVEVTARGRSLGLVLFGAQQFASSVEKEIVENSSTFMFGRTESTEMRMPNYSGFSPEIKTKLTMLPQGQLLVKFPKFPQPIFVKFPYPPALPGDDYVEPGA
jgi:hypothetical protein